MKRFVLRQLSYNRPLRAFSFWLHPKIHPEAHLPTSFNMSGGCVLCRVFTWAIPDDFMRQFDDALADRSQIELEPGTPTSRKIVMSATVKRQLEALSDPEKKAAIENVMREIARK